MDKIRFTLKTFAFVVFTLACATAAQAQATRTWVSGVGDDVNPCSRTAPCKTFAGAISKTADGGEIDALDPGGFGTVTITKSITIDGTTGAGFGSILAAGTTGVNANDSLSGAPMSKIIRLRNLSINGAGTGTIGVNYTSAKTVYVENCSIFGFKAGTGVGVRASLTADGGQLFVRDSNITEILNDGISATTSTGTLRMVVDHCHINKASNGIHIQKGTQAVVGESEVGQNTNGGIFIDEAVAGVASAQIQHCVLNANANGINTSGGVLVRISDNLITNNTSAGVNIAGATVFTFGDNKIRGNGPGGVTDVAGGALNTTQTKQ